MPTYPDNVRTTPGAEQEATRMSTVTKGAAEQSHIDSPPGADGGPSRADIHHWMLDATDDVIIVVGPDDTYVEVNQAYVEALGRARAELIGARVDEVIGEPDFSEYVKPALQECRATGRAEYWITRRYRPDLAVRQRVTYSKILWPGSSEPYILGIARKI